MKKGFRQQPKQTNKQRRKAELMQGFIEDYMKLCNQYGKTIKASIVYGDPDKQTTRISLNVADFMPEDIIDVPSKLEMALEEDVVNGTIVPDTDEHKARKEEVEEAHKKAVDELEQRLNALVPEDLRVEPKYTKEEEVLDNTDSQEENDEDGEKEQA